MLVGFKTGVYNVCTLKKAVLSEKALHCLLTGNSMQNTV